MNNSNFISSEITRSGLIFFKAVSFRKKTIKTVKDENIDDKEEYLNISETTNHV